MDSEKLELLRMATAYDSLSRSDAFRDLIAWLEDSVQTVEMQAATALPESKQHFEGFFTLWQQRKKVVNGIKIHVQEYVAAKKELEEELNNERPDNTSYSPSGDTSLSGYGVAS